MSQNRQPSHMTLRSGSGKGKNVTQEDVRALEWTTYVENRDSNGQVTGIPVGSHRSDSIGDSGGDTEHLRNGSFTGFPVESDRAGVPDHLSANLHRTRQTTHMSLRSRSENGRAITQGDRLGRERTTNTADLDVRGMNTGVPEISNLLGDPNVSNASGVLETGYISAKHDHKCYCNRTLMRYHIYSFYCRTQI